MAGTESSEKQILKLKLLVDKEKNKVVLAEAGKDFVNVLFSLLTLPMGTIVRLLKKHQQDQNFQATTIGCFNNLYKNVVDLGVDNFLSEACKEMLLYPRSLSENRYKGLRLNIDDTVYKFSMCPSCSKRDEYSDLCSARCYCGELMGKEIEARDYSRIGLDLQVKDLFESQTLFTITDKMEVGFASLGLTLKTLKNLGYTDASQLQEMFVDDDHRKVLDLLHCLFSSDTPLTDVFLMPRTSGVTKPVMSLQESYEGKTSKELMSVTVFTSKVDKKVLYVESGKEFVDLLFTFLALPLKYVWEISGSGIGCIDNLCEIFKSLCSSKEKCAFPGYCRLPGYYICDQICNLFLMFVTILKVN